MKNLENLNKWMSSLLPYIIELTMVREWMIAHMNLLLACHGGWSLNSDRKVNLFFVARNHKSWRVFFSSWAVRWGSNEDADNEERSFDCQRSEEARRNEKKATYRWWMYASNVLQHIVVVLFLLDDGNTRVASKWWRRKSGAEMSCSTGGHPACNKSCYNTSQSYFFFWFSAQSRII